MADPDENVPMADAPPPPSPLASPSFEDEEKALKKGRGKMLFAMIVAVAAAIGALAFYLSSGDDETYGNFGRQINGLHQTEFRAFWNCTFQNYPLDNLRTNADVERELHKRASRGKERFGRMVRERCLPKLAEMEPALRVLIPPEEFQGQVNELADAVGELRGGWSDFVAHLEGLEGAPYDETVAADSVGRISKGWYDYRRTHNDLNKALKTKIGH